MPDKRSFVFSGVPLRLDVFLSKELSPISRTRIQALIGQGLVSVNGAKVAARFLLSPRDEVKIELPDFSRLPTAAADSVPILHEDDEVLVVDKPADLVVHPAGPHREDTLVQRLWPKLAKAWGETVRRGKPLVAVRPGVVHRLDRGTSGAMVIAKTPAAAENLSAQFAARTVRKIYWALVWGVPRTQTGHIRSVVGRSRSQPHRMSTSDQGRWSETDFSVEESFPRKSGEGWALLKVHPLTGRTHQIRVQLAALGHPIVGDKTYGKEEDDLAARPLLHAGELGFAHPKSGKKLAFKAEFPADFEAALKKLRKGGSGPVFGVSPGGKEFKKRA